MNEPAKRLLSVGEMIALIARLVKVLSRIRNVLSGVFIVLLGTLVGGVIGFHHFEKLGWFDSFYFTIVTIATIGFGDITPKTTYGKILVVVIATIGISSFAIAVTSLIETMVREKVGEFFGMVNPTLNKHVVICGWNETAKAALKELLASTKKKIVIVDGELDRPPVDDLRVSLVKGDYKERDVLLKAAVDSASNVIVATGNDSDTIMTVLQIRSLNKKIHIAAEARGGNVQNVLKQAGASHVITSLDFGGRMLATSVSQPGTASIFDDLSSTGAGNDVYEVKIPSSLQGKTFREILLELKEETNVLPIALRRKNNIIINPGLKSVIDRNDQLVIVCRPEELKLFKKKYKQ